MTVTFAAVGSVGSMGLMRPQGWLKHPDLWLTSVSLGPDGHGRRQQLPLQGSNPSGELRTLMPGVAKKIERKKKKKLNRQGR